MLSSHAVFGCLLLPSSLITSTKTIFASGIGRSERLFRSLHCWNYGRIGIGRPLEEMAVELTFYCYPLLRRVRTAPVRPVFPDSGPSAFDAHDPNVWTGGALQEKSVSWVFGLASMYPAFGWSSCAPGHHGCKRAFDLISCQASRGLFGSPVLECAVKTVAPSLPFSLADLGGEIDDAGYIALLPPVPWFDCGRSFIPTYASSTASCRGVVKAGPVRATRWLGLDNAEHGARLTRVGTLHLTFS